MKGSGVALQRNSPLPVRQPSERQLQRKYYNTLIFLFIGPV